MKTLTVELGTQSYPIFIGEGLISHPDCFARYMTGKQALIVSNETIASLYLEQVTAALSGFNTKSVILPDGEQYKNLDTVNLIFDRLLQERFDRRTTLIALGGGVVGDITGFAAACYQRGVNFIQAPTTLLAQVDSSVGGKTGVNHPLGKNMIGAFYQPGAVIADTNTLDTLDDRQLSAGIAEVIKYGLIRDLPFFKWLESNMEQLLDKKPDILTQAIERSCRNKTEVVAADERESGERALLNLGHTYGHAIEAGTGYGVWLHGEAVGAGMCMAARHSADIGWVSQEDVRRVETLIKRARLPVSKPTELTVDKMLQYIQVDKKVCDGVIRLVLLKALGKAVVTADYPADSLQRALL